MGGGDEGGGVRVRAGGRGQLIMSNTYNTTHFWSEKEQQHLHTVLIVDTFSLRRKYSTSTVDWLRRFYIL
jgi:hypothetical protein